MLGSGAKFTEMPENSVIKINHILMLCLKIITVDAKIFMLSKIPNLEKQKNQQKTWKHAECHAEADRHLKPKEKSVLLTLYLKF